MTKRALENDLCQSYEVVVSKSNLSQGGTLCLFLRKSDVPATVNQVVQRTNLSTSVKTAQIHETMSLSLSSSDVVEKSASLPLSSSSDVVEKSASSSSSSDVVEKSASSSSSSNVENSHYLEKSLHNEKSSSTEKSPLLEQPGSGKELKNTKVNNPRVLPAVCKVAPVQRHSPSVSSKTPKDPSSNYNLFIRSPSKNPSSKWGMMDRSMPNSPLSCSLSTEKQCPLNFQTSVPTTNSERSMINHRNVSSLSQNSLKITTIKETYDVVNSTEPPKFDMSSLSDCKLTRRMASVKEDLIDLSSSAISDMCGKNVTSNPPQPQLAHTSNSTTPSACKDTHPPRPTSSNDMIFQHHLFSITETPLFTSHPDVARLSQSYNSLMTVYTELAAQRTRTLQDIDKIEMIKSSVSRNPGRFVNMLKRGNIVFPCRQSVVQIPEEEMEFVKSFKISGAPRLGNEDV